MSYQLEVPLIFKSGSRQFQLEYQTIPERLGDSCEGCVFSDGRGCGLPHDVSPEVDEACIGQGINTVWREMK